MSSFWEGIRQKRCAILSKKALIAEESIAGSASKLEGEGSHRTRHQEDETG